MECPGRCHKILRKDSRPPARHAPPGYIHLHYGGLNFPEYSGMRGTEAVHPLQTGMSQIQAQYRWTADNAPPVPKSSVNPQRPYAGLLPGRPFTFAAAVHDTPAWMQGSNPQSDSGCGCSAHGSSRPFPGFLDLYPIGALSYPHIP